MKSQEHYESGTSFNICSGKNVSPSLSLLSWHFLLLDDLGFNFHEELAVVDCLPHFDHDFFDSSLGR